jgi:hypothetical protein
LLLQAFFAADYVLAVNGILAVAVFPAVASDHHVADVVSSAAGAAPATGDCAFESTELIVWSHLRCCIKTSYINKKFNLKIHKKI